MSRADVMKKMKYLLRFLPDEKYVKLYHLLRVKRRLNLENPVTFNEKLNWLKFNDRSPKYTEVVDKVTVRDYIKNSIGEEYLVKIYGVWDKFDDINFDLLPDQFVLKCNHDSGGLVICKDKKNLDLNAARKKIEDSLKCQFYYVGREWQYKNIKPQIICEEYLEEPGQAVPCDYKISCFNGKADNIMLCRGRFKGAVEYLFFDLDWNLLRYNKKDSQLPKDFTVGRPENLELMIRLAEELSKDYYYARIDFYNINGKVYFGEITLCPNSGFDADITYETDVLFGNKLTI